MASNGWWEADGAPAERDLNAIKDMWFAETAVAQETKKGVSRLLVRLFAYAKEHGVTEIHRLSPSIINRWFKSLPVNDNARATYRSHLAVFYKWAKKHRYIPVSPFADDESQSVEYFKRIYRPGRIPAEVIVARMLKEAYQGDSPFDLRGSAILFALYGVGVRVSELTRVQLDDITRVRGFERDRAWLRVRVSKGRKEYSVAVPTSTLHKIDRYIEQARPHFDSSGKSKLLFPHWNMGRPTKYMRPEGSGLTRERVWQIVTGAATSIGIDPKKYDVFPHGLRARFATEYLKRGKDATQLKVVMDLLGHARWSVTIEHYIKEAKMEQEERADKWENHLDERALTPMQKAMEDATR